ncbi:lipase family protein [Humidisolicoccus flavus]|uniref:lipase family protein n=1 Tax=Humidisolicoccus flavus TaxID=3111414 RepID=UPI0032530188
MNPESTASLQRSRTSGVLGLALCVVGGLALICIGLFLLSRPLTTLLVLAGAFVVFLAVGAIVIVSRRPRSLWRWTLALLGAALGLLIALLTPSAIQVLPFLVAAALAANAGRLGARAFARDAQTRQPLAHRILRIMFAVSNLIFAILAWLWPDVASIVIAALSALAITASGAILGVRGISRARHAARNTDAPPAPDRMRARPRLLLSGVAAALSLLIAASGLYGSLQLRSGIAKVDDFYAWSEAIPETPGQVLRVGEYEGELPAGADAVRVLYSTSYSDGSPALASAVVAYPTVASAAPRIVLAWQHGTTGVAPWCGPSVGPEALTEYAIPGIGRAIANDWAVVATDYPGQGTSGPYPYLIGEGEGRATIDGIRAAQQVEAANASASAWIWGHSQGGHATLWAGEIASEYAPELEILGVAALSAASDPLALAEGITTGTSSALDSVVTSLVLVPYSEEYDDVSLADSVHPAGHGLVQTFASRCVAEALTLISVLVGLAISFDAPLYSIDVTSGPTHDRLAQNIADGLVPVPLFLGQGIDDEVIPIQMQRDLTSQLCGASRTVEAHEYPGRTHMGVIAEGAPLIDDLYDWADAVLQGASPNNCGTSE